MSPLVPTGGRVPYIKENAGVGPARTLWAEADQALPASPWDIVPAVADADGEYPALAGWNDLGLAADPPAYTHGKDTSGLEYEQVAGNLFEKITAINRSFTSQIAEISPENMKIMENSETVAALAAAVGKSAVDIVHTGLYQSLKQYRIAFLFYRPDGAGVVTEPAPSPVGSRPPLVMRVFPLCALAPEDTDVEISSEDPVNMEVQFTVLPDSAAGARKEHGYWAFEQAGAIT